MLAAKQAEQIELMEPKAEEFDTYLDTTKNMLFTEAEKPL